MADTFVTKPVDWVAMALSDSVKGLSFERDAENNLKAVVAVMMDPATGDKMRPISGAPNVSNVWVLVCSVADGTTTGGDLNTAVPGKKFRVNGWSIQVTGDAALAAAGICTVKIRENNATGQLFGQADFYLPNAAPATPGLGTFLQMSIPPSGKMGAKEGGKLVAIVSPALTSGEIIINALGDFE